jgi:hypothetical protein
MVPNLQIGDPTRIVVEAYPGVLARKFIGTQSYKNDSKKKQTDTQRVVRRNLLRQLTDDYLTDYGLNVVADKSLAEDPTGDELDALLCAIQAAWSWTQRENGFGAPSNVDALEGWIADPKCRQSGKTNRSRPRLWVCPNENLSPLYSDATQLLTATRAAKPNCQVIRGLTCTASAFVSCGSNTATELACIMVGESTTLPKGPFAYAPDVKLTAIRSAATRQSQPDMISPRVFSKKNTLTHPRIRGYKPPKGAKVQEN